MRRTNPEEHERKRRQILDAAAICFAEKGFEATRTADICQRAGISSGKLFHYFKSKRDVFIAIFAQGQSEDGALLDRATEAPNVVSAIVGFFQQALSHRDSPVMAGLLFEGIAFARHDTGFAMALEGGETSLRDRFAALVEHAVARGEAGSTVDPSQAADWLMGLHDLAILRAAWSVNQSPRADRDMIETLVRAILDATPNVRSGEKS